ncbi:MAG: dephospho-CoA kinase [Desulfobulbaceae bacterium]
MKTCYPIGITGTIGSGKSTVSRLWSRFASLPLIDVDHLCRELLAKEKHGWAALRQHLDAGFFEPDGNLDRRALREALFSDPDLRRQVDGLVHPLARDLLRERLAGLSGPVLVDVPLLFEAGWQDAFQRVVMVYADPSTCCRRVARRDNISPDEAARAIGSQLSPWEKAMRADHVVDNRYCRLYTGLQVVHLAAVIGSLCVRES